MAGGKLLNPDAKYPDCMFCCDKGLTFDEFNQYRFCTCRCGLALAQQEPYAAIQANKAYSKVQMIGGQG